MQINSLGIKQQYNFKGWDVMPLKGLYMQGLIKPVEKRIFREMTEIARKEHLDLFINQNNKSVKKTLTKFIIPDKNLSIWAQDRKAFVKSIWGDTIYINTDIEDVPKKSDLATIGKYEIQTGKYMPRGGNYYLGYKKNGERWAIVNSSELCRSESFKVFGDCITKEMFCELFDIHPENMFIIDEFFTDLDMVVRPIGYPYVLVNDNNEVLKNIEKLRKKFPYSKDIINKLQWHAEESRQQDHAQKLKEFGFIPINIGGCYWESINFMNAIAFENKNHKISYITNSTRNSCPELEYLERLFEKDLREKVKDIERVHFVSGGKKTKNRKPKFSNKSKISLLSRSSEEDNSIMDILANRLGGIHCMTAEIPK